jgi:hypothetical protein
VCGFIWGLIRKHLLDWVVGPKTKTKIIAEISTGSMKDGTFSTRDS